MVGPVRCVKEISMLGWKIRLRSSINQDSSDEIEQIEEYLDAR